MLDLGKLKKLERKEYRDAYLDTTVRSSIAVQMQALRAKEDLSQTDFAELTGKTQSVISRLEDTEYGLVSVKTLLDVAKATGVALVVRFVDYPTFLGYAGKMATSELQPDTIADSVSKANSSAKAPYQIPSMQKGSQVSKQDAGSMLITLRNQFGSIEQREQSPPTISAGAFGRVEKTLSTQIGSQR